MPFLGKTPAQGFVNSVTKDDFTPNGTTTAFTLSKSPATVNELEVYVGNVRQEPTDAYSVSGTTLTMTEAPATGTNFYVMHIGGTTQSSTTLPGGSTVPGDFNVSGDSTVLGQIAIGTTTINRDIHISTARPDIRLTDTTDNSYSEIVYNANSFSIQVDPDQTVDSSAFIVKTDGTTRIRVDSNGLQFGTGNAAANYLNDYEEGSWTPVYGSNGTAPTVSYATQLGSYTKIGNTVILGMYIATSSKSGGSGNLRITGIPFAQASGTGGYGSKAGNIQNWVGGLTQNIGGFVNVDRIEMRRGNNTVVTTADLRTSGDSNQIWWSLSYQTDA